MLTRALLAFTKNWASHYLWGTSAQSRRPCSSRCDPFNLVALDNLVDLIVTCGRVSARLLPVPAWALQVGAALLGKGDAVQRLCGNLQVDISKARNLLGWLPRAETSQ